MSEGNRTTAKAPLVLEGRRRRTLLVFERDRTRVVDLPEQGTLVVGRAEGLDVVVADPAISRRQLELLVDPEGVRARDLRSSNGTLLGDRPLVGTAALVPGVPIRMGGAMMLLADSGPGSGSCPLPHVEFEARLAARLESVRARGGSVAAFMIRATALAETLDPAVRKVLGSQCVIGEYGRDHYEVAIDAGPGGKALDLARALERGLESVGIAARVGCALFPRDATSPGDLLAACTRALRPEPSPPRAFSLVVADPAMQRVLDLARQVAAGRIPVLLLGETGSGKEVLAEHIHRFSPRADRPLLRINCAALPESLLEAELFGYEKGAFTGATGAKAGLFEAADGGTLFLDEIGELPVAQQAKLLRALEDGTIRRLGSLKDKQVDVRLVAATNRNIEEAARRGDFRSDLYYRLGGAVVTIPPLRDRPRDVIALARRFVEDFAGGARRLGLASMAEQALLAHPWPGNVRELRNAMERAVLLCTGGEIGPEHLPDRVRLGAASAPAPGSSSSDPPGGWDAARAEKRAVERSLILEALDGCGGNQTRAAERLGISRRTMVSRLAEFGIGRKRRPGA